MTELPENVTVVDEEVVEKEPYAYIYTTGPFSLPANAESIYWKILNNDSTAQEVRVTVFRCITQESKRVEPPGTLNIPLDPNESFHNANDAEGGASYEVRVECNSGLILPYACAWPARGADPLPASDVKAAEFQLYKSVQDRENDRHDKGEDAKENDKEVISDFQLFAPGSECDARLPQNPIKDEFVITRFVALTKMDNGGPVINSTVPAVLPRDLVIPGSAEFLTRQAPQVTPQALKGGAPLVPEWDDIFLGTARPDAGINEVTIDDVDGVLAHPDDFVFEGRNVELDLNPVAIRSLLDYGSATVVARDKDGGDGNGLLRRQAGRYRLSDVERNDTDDVGDENGDDGEDGRNGTDHEGNGNGYTGTLITLKAQRGGIPDGHGVENAVRITDLYTFLSDPRVKATTEISYPAKLTSGNVRELTTVGTSEVEVEVGGERKKVLVTTARSDTQRDSETPVAGADGTASLLAEAPRAVGAPSVQLPTFELMLYLPYRQTWTLKGYWRGELLNTFSLAPQEETTIEVFTWDRVKRSKEITETVETENLYESNASDKDTLDTLKETAKKSSWTRSIRGDFGLHIGGVIDVGGGISAQNQNEINRISRDTHQHISEQVTKASDRIKTSHQTKVNDTEEFGSETRTTRKIRNQNMCRTLNLDCFEVLVSYEVKTELIKDQVRLCALTSNPLSSLMQINRKSLITFEAPLRAALLAENFASGFDAARKLSAWENRCKVRCAQECACEATGGVGAEAPAVAAARDKVLRAAHTMAITYDQLRLTGTLKDLIDAVKAKFTDPEEEELLQGAIINYQRWQYYRLFLANAPEFFSGSAGSAAVNWAQQLWTFLRQTTRTIDDVEKLLASADTVGEEILNAAEHSLIWAPRLWTLVGETYPKDPDYKAWAATWASVADFELGKVFGTKATEYAGLNDAGLYTDLTKLRGAHNEYRQTLLSPDNQQKPKEMEESLAWDLARAMDDEQALIDHITVNQSYYQYVIWEAIDPNARYAYLSGLGNLVGWVDNEVLGFVDSKAALPLRLDNHPEVNYWFEGNVLENKQELFEPSESYTVTLPTPGVTLEPRLGQCDGCEEFITESRMLDLRRTAAEAKSARERAQQEELETQRYEKRLDKDPPLLDDPDPNENRAAIRVEVSKENEG
jgi:hypothetical protein